MTALHSLNRGRPATDHKRQTKSNYPVNRRALGPLLREALILAILLALSALVLLAPTGGLGRQ